MITIESSDPHCADSSFLIGKLSAELAAITGDSGKNSFSTDSLAGERALWVVARDKHGEARGCGAIRPLTDDIAELKRMYSDRRLPGTGRALLAFLETAARNMGYRELWLETRQINHRAVAFYQKNGYVRIENYGPYAGRAEAVCFAKTLKGAADDALA